MSNSLRRRAALAVVIGLLFSSAACGSSSTAPTGPVTETLNGILVPTASAWHVFSTSGSGDVTITLVSLSPLAGITVGMGIGIAANNACSLQYTSEVFKVGTVWATSLGNKGAYCVAIYDTGQVSQNTNYSIRITHP